MKKILLCGALGKMGRQVAALAAENGFEIAAGVDFASGAAAPFPVYPGFDSPIQEAADVIIDFSRPAVLEGLLRYAAERKLPCVLCSTGYGEKENAMIQEASRVIPVFVSANMSQGVYALKKLIRLARQLLPQADIEIVEKHHRYKDDAPSGTAVALLDALRDESTALCYGREGKNTRRQSGEIGVHAVRGGTVCGDHEVNFFLDDEIVTLTHHAQSRAIFAGGALKAAHFIMDQQPGLYGMEEMMK